MHHYHVCNLLRFSVILCYHCPILNVLFHTAYIHVHLIWSIKLLTYLLTVRASSYLSDMGRAARRFVVRYDRVYFKLHFDWVSVIAASLWLLFQLSGAGYLAAAGAGAGAAAAGGMTSRHQQVPVISLTYFGSVIMSFGCFAFIFAFVMFCEARDHAIDYYIRSKVYAASSRGPRPCRLLFRQDVLHLIIAATKRRAEKQSYRSSGLSPTASVASPCPGEAASAIKKVPDTVDDKCVTINRRPALLSVSESVNRTTDWLLSNGMLNTEALDQVSATLDAVRPKHLELGQERASDRLLSNGMLEELSSESDGKVSVAESDHVTDSDQDGASVHDVGWTEHWKAAEVVPLLTFAVPKNSDTATESAEVVETSMTCAERAQVALASLSSVSSSPPPPPSSSSSSTSSSSSSSSLAPPPASSSFSSSLSSSSSSSSLPLLPPPATSSFDVPINSEVVCDQRMTPTTPPKSNKEVDQTVDDSSPMLPGTAPDSTSSNTSKSPDLGSHSSPSSGSTDADDVGKPPKMSCRLPSAERSTPSPTFVTAEPASRSWKQSGDGKREQETAIRSHAGIHHPPPLPPPPTSPTVVATSGRSHRKHR